jgi:hypothetical protein
VPPALDPEHTLADQRRDLMLPRLVIDHSDRDSPPA